MFYPPPSCNNALIWGKPLPPMPRPSNGGASVALAAGALVAGIAIGSLWTTVYHTMPARAAAAKPVTITKIHTVRVCDSICTAPSKNAAHIVPETNYASSFIRDGRSGSLPPYDRDAKVRAGQYRAEAAERAVTNAANARAEADAYRARMRLQESLFRRR